MDTMRSVAITSISAHSFNGEQSHTNYSKVFLESPVAADGSGKKYKTTFMPGMTVEVNIISGEERLLAYIFTPIIRGLNSALTERSTR